METRKRCVDKVKRKERIETWIQLLHVTYNKKRRNETKKFDTLYRSDCLTESQAGEKMGWKVERYRTNTQHREKRES